MKFTYLVTVNSLASPYRLLGPPNRRLRRERAMSTMEPDEGTEADAPRWEKTEAANPAREADAPRWERVDADDDAADDGADSSDSSDS
jgi:hypothetical protein